MQAFGVIVMLCVCLLSVLLNSILRPARARMNPPVESEIEKLNSRVLDTSLDPLRSIFEQFKPHVWYFGLVDLYRRAFLLCLPGFLRSIGAANSSAMRLLVCSAYSFAVMVAYEHVTPFNTRSLSILSRVSLMQVRVLSSCLIIIPCICS